jgi:hypothetical protein
VRITLKECAWWVVLGIVVAASLVWTFANDDAKRLVRRMNRTCEVHDVALQPGTSEIRYGLLVGTAQGELERQRLYPNANSWIAGGCVISSEKSEDVMYCEQCREVERQRTGVSRARADRPESPVEGRH